ncbi:3008_t:CDS:1, partial [Funneliformis caledonium]
TDSSDMKEILRNNSDIHSENTGLEADTNINQIISSHLLPYAVIDLKDGKL